MKEFQIKNFTFKLGKNKFENDKLIDESGDYDIWFHINNLPSSHGILFTNSSNKVDRAILKICCLFLKQNSKYKSEKKLEIIVCKISNIRKTKNIGEVIIGKNFKIITI